MKIIKWILNNRFRQRVKEIVFESPYDFLQLSHSSLYFACGIVFMLHYFEHDPKSLTYEWLTNVAPPLAWVIFFFIKGILTAYDLFNIDKKVKFVWVYLFGSSFWAAVSVGLFMNVGISILIALTSYTAFHSGWLFIRLTNIKKLRELL